MRAILLLLAACMAVGWARPSSSGRCAIACTANWAPICGDDGVTYSNRCGLYAHNLCEQTDVQKAHDGVCGEDSSSSLRRALEQAIDRCDRVCPMNYAPICDQQGNRYSNPCELRVASCKSDGEIHPKICHMDYRPVCAARTNSSGHVTYQVFGNPCMLEGAICASDDPLEPVDALLCGLCSWPCTANYDPVCGVAPDGTRRGFSNMCEMGAASCREQTEYMPPMCTANYDPVCGSDGQKYANECELGVRTCATNGDVTGMMCTYNYDPVCGDNGTHVNEYSNQCALTYAHCVSEQGVTEAPCPTPYRRRDLEPSFNRRQQRYSD